MNFDIIYAKDIEQIQTNKRSVLIDIRPESSYERCHAKDAISLPFETTDSYEQILDRNQYYIFYCEFGGSSMKLARYLGNRGFYTGTVIGGFSALSEYLKKVGLCDKI